MTCGTAGNLRARSKIIGALGCIGKKDKFGGENALHSAHSIIVPNSLLKSAEPTENSLNRLTSIARSLFYIYMDSGSHGVWPERRIGVQCRVFQQAAKWYLLTKTPN
jgi:hypothetical protein